MATILAFNGSPRLPHGFTGQLLRIVLDAARAQGAQVRLYDMNRPDIQGCQSCFSCRREPRCCIQDDLQPVYDEMADAAGIIFTTPIYFGDISSQAKKFIDRMFPMVDGTSFAPRHPGKRVVTIVSHGDDDPERFHPAINRVHAVFQTFGWHVMDTLVSCGTSTSGYTIPKDLEERARQAGRALAE